MTKIKNTPFSLYLFCLGCLALTLHPIYEMTMSENTTMPTALEGSASTAPSIAVPKKEISPGAIEQVEVFLLEELRPSLELKADQMLFYQENQNASFQRPRGNFYTPEGTKTEFESMSGTYSKELQDLTLMNQVKLKMDSETVHSEEMHYDLKKEKIVAKVDVKTDYISPKSGDHVTLWSQELEVWPKLKKASYTGMVKGHLQRMRKFERPLDFSANSIYLDLNKSYVELKENVFIKNQDLTLTARRGEIFLENYNKKLKYYGLYDDVKIKEKLSVPQKGVLLREAYAERLEGYMQSEKIVLTGSPKVIQGTDIVKGNVITLIQNTEAIEIDDANSKFTIKAQK